jgi:ABC-type branched-subunit amino acid transport system ATPase component
VSAREVRAARIGDAARRPQDEGTPNDGPVLVVERLSKHFGGLRAVNDVTFAITTGSITSIIGPNGAGKSTLFNVVTGVLAPTLGEIYLSGSNVTGWQAHRLCAAGIGRTFQNTQLFPNLNVLENVLAGTIARTKASYAESLLWLPRHRHERVRSIDRAKELLTELDVGHRLEYLPRELPYGDQRRVEVARALATDPYLLMLDEPLAGMTQNEAADFVAVIRKLTEAQRTVIVIEHNVRQVMAMSDHVIVMNFGTKIAEGPPSEILHNEDVLEAYLG